MKEASLKRYDSVYMTLSKRQNCSDGEEISGSQGLGMGGDFDYKGIVWVMAMF